MEKFLAGHGQKWVQPIWCLNSKIDFINLKNELMELTDFLRAGTVPLKLKGNWKFLGWTWSKMGAASLVMGL